MFSVLLTARQTSFEKCELAVYLLISRVASISMYSPIGRAASWNPEYHVTRAEPLCRQNTGFKGLRYSAP